MIVNRSYINFDYRYKDILGNKYYYILYKQISLFIAGLFVNLFLTL